MSHSQPQAAVSAIPVLTSSRLLTLDSLFPHGRGLRVYVNTLMWASRLTTDLEPGCRWDLFRLTNGGFFMAPTDQKDRLYRIFSPNGSIEVVSAEAMGIICCLFAYSHLRYQPWFQPDAHDHFHLLRDYARTHKDARRIFATIS